MAGLKVCQAILGSLLLPLPSLFLSGLTNIEGIIKREPPFEDMLRSTLELQRQKKERLIVFIGYLGSAKQAEILCTYLDQYKDRIEQIIVDPVSGDHGRQYVPDAVVEAWPSLLARADIALPNYTELQLLSGAEPNLQADPLPFVQQINKAFPQLNILVTSYPVKTDDKIGLMLFQGNNQYPYAHPKLDHNFHGSGDLFASTFIYYRSVLQQSSEQAMQAAAHATLSIIQHSANLRQTELYITHFVDKARSSAKSL